MAVPIKTRALRARNGNDKSAAKLSLREPLLKAARDLFAREGYEQVSMRRIAAEVGCSAMAAYRYFESKDELLIATCEEVFSELARMRESRAGSQETTPIERLKDQLRTFIEFGVSHPNSYKLIFMTEISNSSLSRQREAIVQKGMAGLREKVQQCANAAKVEVDVSLTSQALRIGATGLVAGTIARAISRKDEKQLITKLINLLTADFI